MCQSGKSGHVFDFPVGQHYKFVMSAYCLKMVCAFIWPEMLQRCCKAPTTNESTSLEWYIKTRHQSWRRSTIPSSGQVAEGSHVTFQVTWLSKCTVLLTRYSFHSNITLFFKITFIGEVWWGSERGLLVSWLILLIVDISLWLSSGENSWLVVGALCSGNI